MQGKPISSILPTFDKYQYLLSFLQILIPNSLMDLLLSAIPGLQENRITTVRYAGSLHTSNLINELSQPSTLCAPWRQVVRSFVSSPSISTVKTAATWALLHTAQIID